MKILHFSDLHAGAFPDSFSAFFDKRIVGTANFTLRRRYLHDFELMRKAVDFILSEDPDVAVCTGDITSTGQPREFSMALDALRPLINHSKIKLIYIPGNHDLYVRNRRCRSAAEDAFRAINGNTFELNDLPAKIAVGECDFFLVNECKPTSIVMSTGYFSKDSIERIEQFCEEQKQRPRIIVGHFPLTKKYPISGFRHRIYGHKPVLELLKTSRIDLSLCGHTHKNFKKVDEMGKGEVGAGSITRTGDINIIEYNASKDIFNISTHFVNQ